MQREKEFKLLTIMQGTDLKVLCFEYIIHKLVLWYKELCPSEKSPVQNFTRLKAQKLLFFVASVKATENDSALLDVFDNFYAMQYGPVEIDVYSLMVLNGLTMYHFKERYTEKKNSDCSIFDDIPQETRNLLDDSIEELRKKNSKIVSLTASQLIDISHKWTSWNVAIACAEIFGKKRWKMSTENIAKDRKIYE